MMLILPLISAQEVYKQNQATDIKASCINGIPIANCTCKLSIQNPDGSFLINDATMTDLGTGFYNYTLTFTNLGTYQMTQSCTDGTYKGTQSAEVIISSTGETSSSGQNGLIFILFGMTVFFSAMSFVFSKEKWKMRGAMFIFALLSLILALNAVRVISGASGTLNTMLDMGLLIGIAAASFMVVYLLVHYTIEIIKKIKDKKERRWEASNNVI